MCPAGFVRVALEVKPCTRASFGERGGGDRGARAALIWGFCSNSVAVRGYEERRFVMRTLIANRASGCAA